MAKSIAVVLQSIQIALLVLIIWLGANATDSPLSFRIIIVVLSVVMIGGVFVNILMTLKLGL
jgi:hypothetical protein